MCDTLGFVTEKKAIFGKNSDRSPNEPQIIEFIPAGEHSEAEIQATYISVPQVAQTHAVLLSRPTWLWGAEIGVNDCGVCIGNEAVWTLGKYGKNGLTGMDMLRLALERSESAIEAVHVLTSLLEQYGQGGNCGYDHEFLYDNSFLVMDRELLYVLETSGREWVYKKYPRASISNRLSIGSDGDEYSSGKAYDFALRHSERAYNIASGSNARKKQTGSCISTAESVEDIMNALRKHNSNAVNPFATGSVSSTCMHFGGLVGDHTTASLVVDIQDGRTLVWSTGSSAPCVSFFKPWVFGSDIPAYINCGAKYWYEQESFRRGLVGKVIPKEYFIERNEIEQSWLSTAGEDTTGLSDRCVEEEKSFYDKWKNVKLDDMKTASGFKKRWNAKNEIFLKEMALQA